jgi:hypothetical protein
MLVHPLQGRKDASPVKFERVPLEGRVVVLIELSCRDYRLVNSNPSHPLAFRAHRWVDQDDSREFLRVDTVSRVHMVSSIRFLPLLATTHPYVCFNHLDCLVASVHTK